MDTTLVTQALQLIDKSKSFILLTHARADADGLGAMLSMMHALKELGKDVTAVTSDPVGESLQFLPWIQTVQNTVASSRDFVITLDCAKTPLSKIKYNLEDNKVHIIVTPKEGGFTPTDVSFGQSGAKYDLIMTFDTGNLEHLGLVYDQNSEMFFKIPILNVDHHASNTDFGQVNLVDVVSASTTQVLLPLLKEMEKKYGKKLITEDVATLLLAGLITDTGSFQHANTSPASMECAAELLDLGARQQEIVKNIYKTKKLSTLKLWGIVLSKVQVDPALRMVWSAVSREDLKDSGADAEETGDIIDNLLSNAPGAELIMLIKEHEAYVSVSLRSTTNAVDVGKFSGSLGGGGHVRAAGFRVHDKPFAEAVDFILSAARQFQQGRLQGSAEAALPLPTVTEKLKAPMAAPAMPAQAPQKPESKPMTKIQAPAMPKPAVPKPAEAPKPMAPQPAPAAPKPATPAPAAPKKPQYLDFKAPQKPGDQGKSTPPSAQG